MSVQRAESPAKIVGFAARRSRSGLSGVQLSPWRGLCAGHRRAARAARAIFGARRAQPQRLRLYRRYPGGAARLDPAADRSVGILRHFVSRRITPTHWPKFLALLAIGLGGLALYDVGLSSAHPIITAAVLNMSPFWAALVAQSSVRQNARRSRHISSSASFFVAFLAAMVVAWSQIDTDSSARSAASDRQRSAQSLDLRPADAHLFRVERQACSTVWFSRYDEGAAIAANFLVSSIVLIPAAVWLAHGRGPPALKRGHGAGDTALVHRHACLFGGRPRLLSAGVERHPQRQWLRDHVLPLIPALSALVSWPLSRWIVTLRFAPSPLFFGGIALVIAPLLLFAFAALRAQPPSR